MQLASTDIICGQSALVVRQMLRGFSNGSYMTMNSNYFHDLGISFIETQELILALLDEGYLEKDKPSPYFGGDNFEDFPFGLTTTDEGRRIAVTRFGKRMKRKAIEKLVSTVILRAEKTTELGCFTHEVSKVYVFGSYLDEDKSDYGDLDLVCEEREKNAFHGSKPVKYSINQLWEMFRETDEGQNTAIEQINGRIQEWQRLHENGVLDCAPPKPSQYGWIAWDTTTVTHMLKRKNYRISLHSMAEFEHLKTDQIRLIYDIDQGGSLLSKS